MYLLFVENLRHVHIGRDAIVTGGTCSEGGRWWVGSVPVLIHSHCNTSVVAFFVNFTANVKAL